MPPGGVGGVSESSPLLQPQLTPEVQPGRWEGEVRQEQSSSSTIGDVLSAIGRFFQAIGRAIASAFSCCRGQVDSEPEDARATVTLRPSSVPPEVPRTTVSGDSGRSTVVSTGTPAPTTPPVVPRKPMLRYSEQPEGLRDNRSFQTLHFPPSDYGHSHGLSSVEDSSIRIYTRGDISPRKQAYSAMNEFLRASPEGREEMLQDPDYEGVQGLIEQTTRGLSKLPDHVGQVRRQLKDLPPEVLDRYRPGEVVTEQGFTSTTKAPGGSGQIRFVIESRHGKDVSQISGHAKEEEVLFVPSTRFQVTDRSDDPKTGVTVIHMRELEPGE